MIVLSGITIQSKIYEGSASLVYRGFREEDSQAIVIKLLKQDYPSPQELTRYRQEYVITRFLNIEGVIRAYNQQDYQRTLVILLEDFFGESLEYWIQQRPEAFCPMPVSNFFPLAINLSKILGRIHAANVIHKDINLGNIVLNPNTGVVKIIDFGIATQFSRTNPTFKSPHGLEGTLAYLSPEQTGRMNRSIDYRTDFYSLGVTFYELLTGQVPFLTTDILELVHCHLAKPLIPPFELNPKIPKLISDIILKLMAKNAEDRYQSAWGIKADLEDCAYQLKASGQINLIQLGSQDVSDQFQIPQKLYGRDVELAALLTAFDRVAEGKDIDEDAQVKSIEKPKFKVEMMLVSGYSGVGKSALVQELYKPITAKRGYFISGKFDQLQRNIPYSAIVDALRKLVQQLLSKPDESLQRWRSRLLEALGSNGQLIIDVIPEVELIIGKQPPAPEVGATEAQNRFNRFFHQFIRVFCAKDHPLVIFLDDLQWVDSATLQLIELMLLDEQTQALFLIAAYRDNGVSPTHPFALALERLRQQEAVFEEIVLAPLTLEPLAQLIAETLYQDKNTVYSLAELVLRKTEGNPFFVGEFLQLLYSENLLSFIPPQFPLSKGGSKGGWQWNIAQIEAQNITDNVVELLLLKLKKLPENTQQLLQLAACIGAEFDLETLAIVFKRSPKTVSQNLLAAIQAGLIQPLSELEQNLLVQEYKFLHDSVQQAAYALIDESHKQIVHLQIGRNLLEKSSLEGITERLFEIVDHLNHGIALSTEQAERDEIAKLNLMASQRAKGSIAYSTAKNYLAMGREWLATSIWQTDYDLALELYTETTEVTYLCGEFENVEHWAKIVLQKAKTTLDSLKVYEVIIQTNASQRDLLDAIHTGLQVLQQLGISLPEQPSSSDIQLELSTITALLSGKSIKNLIYLPEMTDPDKLAAMQILSRISIPAYITAPNLMPLLVSKQVKLSIQYGNTLVSPYTYANFGLILCGVVGDIEAGYQFGQLALRLLSQSNSHSLKARALNIVNNFIIHWKEHARVLLKPLLEGYQSGLETGDLEFAAYCAYTYCFQSYANGKELGEVERNIVIYGEVIRQIKQEIVLAWNQILRQTILNLMGRSDNSTPLIGESYNEEDELLQYEATNDGSTILAVYFNKLFLCYLFSKYAQAVENAAIAENYIVRLAGTPLEPLYYFYDSLARLAIYLGSSDQMQEELLKKVAVSQEKMKHWAHHAPMNYLHKYYLVEAEKARVLGQLFEAEEFYEQAIQGAKENEYIQEEALSYELAGKHYLARGRERFAQLYMKEAHYCYERWGATAKAKDLETRYPQFFRQSLNVAPTSNRPIARTTSNTSHIAFDLAAVMKASQAISSEIELEQLLRSLMQILIETAGAQTGYLLLENAGEWTLEAACELADGEQICTTKVLQSLPIADRLPESIIQYVIRTHESVILNDATRESEFINDPYIQYHQVQSVLCLPLLTQGKLVGVLYLENRLVTRVFTSERFSEGDATRTQVLNLLSTQAAIAIENAKLYAEQRASKSQLKQFLEAIPVGVAVLDATGRPYYANQRAIQLMGKGIDPSISPDDIAESYQLYLAGTDQNYPNESLPIIRALNGERTRIDDMEILYQHTRIPVEGWGTPAFDEQGNVVYAIVTFQDITERKQAEHLLANYNRTLEQQVAQRTAALERSQAELREVYDELRLREEELRVITDAIPVCITYVDANQRYQFANRTYEEWFHRSRGEILGKHIYENLGEASYQVVQPYINQALAGQITTYEAEIPCVFGNKYISNSLIPDFDSNGQVKGYYGLITDISDRRRAEKASILEERNRMAREIHDSLAQAFTGILLHVGSVTQMLADNSGSAQIYLERLEKIDELARTGLAEARRSVAALRPQLLEDSTLQSALHRLVTQMQSTTKTMLSYESKGVVYSLPTEVENHLLRIGQEALTNAIKYANASQILVELVYDDAQCLLRVKDDGQGFGVGTISSQSGFGLLGMSERAERIGAQLTIQSQPGQGTEIMVTVVRE